ncbi:MAG TPA: aminotransferase class I/II-fold pyridoxal phosphate-dependent enzyme [Casimicrobiaceae bacterium]|nr:aminotransferase class I/II-fold pyridoxal phosphate-dependent enzyme [Casimicrobiaceae bacterium]
MNPLLNERIARFDSPFRRLDALIAGVAPNPQLEPIVMSVGEPQDAPPSWLAEVVAAHAHEWNRYPPAIGTPEFRHAARGYIERRYPATRNRIDPDAEISPVTSTREALYLAASIATSPSRRSPIALMQNPFYQTYRAAAIMAGAEPSYVGHSGFPRFAPELAAVDESTLARTSILYLCSPSNPDGNAIDASVLRRAIEAARRHNFLVVFDECYAELYDGEPPGGALDVLAAMDASGHWLDNVLVLHSLSKRSSAAGMRSGFAVGPVDVMAALNRVRLNGTACTPLPLLAAATALWSEDSHVLAMRQRLSERKDAADRLLGRHPGYYRPPCGFFLWVRVGGGLELTRRLWRDFALKVLPGAFLTQTGPDGTNDSDDYIRVALVHDIATTTEGLSRLASALAIPPAQ